MPIFRQLRYALRSLWFNKSFALVAIVCLMGVSSHTRAQFLAVRTVRLGVCDDRCNNVSPFDPVSFIAVSVFLIKPLDCPR